MSLFSIQISLVILSVMANHAPIDWCGEEGLEEMIVCPADVSGEERDQCLDKEKPCGTYCHKYWNAPWVYCGEYNSCVWKWSAEHIECRNKVTMKWGLFFYRQVRLSASL